MAQIKSFKANKFLEDFLVDGSYGVVTGIENLVK